MQTKILSKIEDTLFMYSEESIVLILDIEFKLSDFTNISFNKKFFEFCIDKEKKLLIPKVKILKDLNNYSNIYIIDQFDFFTNSGVLKKNGIYLN